MAEEIFLPENADKTAIYAELLPQIKALVADEPDLVANLANVSAVLKYSLGYFWVGFYLMKEGELVLGPFQGPLACTRIAVGRGVCGTAAEKRETILVPDVEAFPGHIACSSLSKSEVVVPILAQGEVKGVMDVDSDRLNDFEPEDARFLEQVVQLLVEVHWGGH